LRQKHACHKKAQRPDFGPAAVTKHRSRRLAKSKTVAALLDTKTRSARASRLLSHHLPFCWLDSHPVIPFD
jgi:hypothetical protein